MIPPLLPLHRKLGIETQSIAVCFIDIDMTIAPPTCRPRCPRSASSRLLLHLTRTVRPLAWEVLCLL